MNFENWSLTIRGEVYDRLILSFTGSELPPCCPMQIGVGSFDTAFPAAAAATAADNDA